MPKLPLKNNPKVHHFQVLKLCHLNPTSIGKQSEGDNKLKATNDGLAEGMDHHSFCMALA